MHNSELRISTTEDGKRYLEGYGIVFNSESRLLYGRFIEKINPAAVRGADMSEIVSKYNHDMNYTLGTTWAGTLTYEIDDRGVKYKVELPNNVDGDRVAVLAERGDLRGSSFEFLTKKDSWTKEVRNGKTVEVREILEFEWIGDLSPVISEAYPGTQGLQLQKRFYEERMAEAFGEEKPKTDGYLRLLAGVN